MKKEHINIIAQAFYGNRTSTDICAEDLDRFILGYLDSSLPVTEVVDRTIIRLPGAEYLALIYNQYQEEASKRLKERACNEAQHVLKPLATIPEMNLEIYSRCIACRMTVDGEFQSVEDEDLDVLGKYLAK